MPVVLHSALCTLHFALPARRRGYTLVELFLTLAVVMIILGMMINLSRRVRSESADKATRQILWRLTVLMNEYQRTNHGNLPPVRPIMQEGEHPAESTLQSAALANNADLVRFMNLAAVAEKHPHMDDPLLSGLRKVDAKLWVLEDPWGSPVVFMPHQDPAIGMAPGDAFFLFSAGPDRLYLTREDNVYSYEESGAEIGSRAQ